MIPACHKLTLADRIRSALAYTVQTDEGYTSTAWTWCDATSWAACFPPSWGPVNIYRRGRRIARRVSWELSR